jgi:hypothetical protein
MRLGAREWVLPCQLALAGNLVNEKVAKFDEMYNKYGDKELVSLRS